MFEDLSDKIGGVFKSLSGQHKITEENIDEALRSIRVSLLEADVSYRVVQDVVEKTKAKALGQKVLQSVKPGQMLVKIFQDELERLMGGATSQINLSGSPAVILVCGLQGAGKTTFAAKLANHIKIEHKKAVLLVAADVYRPAAVNQLQILGERIDTPVYAEPGNKDPLAIVRKALRQVEKNQVVIVDTAGRLSIDQVLMDEIAQIHKLAKPSETLFVVDAMTGQDAVNTAEKFNEVLDYDGVVLTKMDGDTRGGAALTIREVTQKPLKFIGTGEKIEDISVFHPDRMASRILGMGDVATLVEKAQQQFDEKEAQRIEKKILKNKFDFEDFLQQIGKVKKMGSMKDLLKMVPGVGTQLKNIDMDDDSFKSIEAMIQSMTPKERKWPRLIDTNRKRRIAKGSGTSVSQVNQLLKQFASMSKMMKLMKNGMNPMDMLGGGMKFPKF